MEMRALHIQYQIHGLQDREINLNKRIEEKELLLKSVRNNIDYWQAESESTDNLEADEEDLEAAVRRRKKEMREVKKRLAAKIARSEELEAQRGHRVRYSPDIAKALYEELQELESGLAATEQAPVYSFSRAI